MAWNYGDIYTAIGAVSTEDHPALIHSGPNGSEGITISWPAFMSRTNRLARFLQNAGLKPDAKVAHYMRNGPSYIESMVGSFKGRFVHVNVNFRYLDDELHYIFDNSDSEAIIFSAEFREQATKLRERLPKVKVWIEVPPTEEPDAAVADYAVSFNEIVASGDDSNIDIERRGDDLLFIYTGGTTGMPKGVMWEHEAIWAAGGGGASPSHPEQKRPATAEEHAERIGKSPFRPRILAACPLMHGTAMLSALGVLNSGGCVVTVPEHSLDSEALWNTVERYRVTNMAIVGDAFAKPLLKELDENPGRHDISSLRNMLSSGVMWSPEVKNGLLQHNKNLVMLDSFGASEAIGFGVAKTSKNGASKPAKFQIGASCKVFTEDHKEVEPGSGTPGFIARNGPIPVGYYKDPKKSAETFPTIDGVRYSIPGDWCTVEKDGTLTLLGRGSVCINSGGEKIYPEEIEEVLKIHPSIDDSLVVGIPDEKWGQAVTGIVKLVGGQSLDEHELREHVRKHLSAYKIPKRIIVAEAPLRAANGKADYKTATNFAISTLDS
ncbi:MAG: acyl-CoA synthetase [Pseudomonadales bacterium]|nr:acyl-CoA synthetase [Pseudomonadales bacterium]